MARYEVRRWDRRTYRVYDTVFYSFPGQRHGVTLTLYDDHDEAQRVADLLNERESEAA